MYLKIFWSKKERVKPITALLLFLLIIMSLSLSLSHSSSSSFFMFSFSLLRHLRLLHRGFTIIIICCRRNKIYVCKLTIHFNFLDPSSLRGHCNLQSLHPPFLGWTPIKKVMQKTNFFISK